MAPDSASLHRTLGPAAPALTVFYDGGCPLCRREIDFYRRRRGAAQINWLDISGLPEGEVAPGLSRCAAMARFHVLLPDGHWLSGGPAFAAVWRALPAFRPLGWLFGFRATGWLADRAYAGFLRLRPRLQRLLAEPAHHDDGGLPPWLLAELRSDHAGETGAVWIYKGMAAVTRDPAVRDFAARHLATEASHLELLNQVLPPRARSRLLPLWRLAGWLTGALPALFGPRAVYLTVDAVETFVDRHYSAQIEALESSGEEPELLALLKRCRDDELEHRDEARHHHGGAPGTLGRLWAALVGSGSAAAVALARRI